MYKANSNREAVRPHCRGFWFSLRTWQDAGRTDLGPFNAGSALLKCSWRTMNLRHLRLSHSAASLFLSGRVSYSTTHSLVTHGSLTHFWKNTSTDCLLCASGVKCQSFKIPDAGTVPWLLKQPSFNSYKILGRPGQKRTQDGILEQDDLYLCQNGHI